MPDGKVTDGTLRGSAERESGGEGVHILDFGAREGGPFRTFE
jgi:hypothetical protein